MHRRCCVRTGRECRSMTMLDQSQQSDWLQTELESMSSQEDFPAKTSQSQDTKQELKASAVDLWSECARLIGELRPRYAIFENVTNLLNGERGDWFKRVLWDISSLGYDAEWHCIPASELGAHHHRDRVWIIAYPSVLLPARGARDTESWQPFRPSGHRAQLTLQQYVRDVADTLLARDYKGARLPETMAKTGTATQRPTHWPDSVEFKGQTNGRLNPTWVEWLMGFPLGHTDLNA